jgi:hypothetical protein
MVKVCRAKERAQSTMQQCPSQELPYDKREKEIEEDTDRDDTDRVEEMDRTQSRRGMHLSHPYQVEGRRRAQQ